MESEPKDQKPHLPKWLRKTQDNSWEPEIFISGIVLFGLTQIPTYLNEFRFYFKREIWGFSSDIDNLIAVLTTSVQWLIFGLALHLFFRGVWIGLVGLSYVFPQGIRNEKLPYKGKFEKRITNIPHFASQIMRLEKVSSSIFSISYFIFMSILGAYSYFLVLIILPVYAFFYLSGIDLPTLGDRPVLINVLTAYIFFVMGIGMINMLDFLSLGLLKRFKLLSRIYYPIYKLVSTLTFSHVYRNVYYVLISNFRTWQVIVFNVLFISMTVYLIGVNSSSSNLSYKLSRLELYGTTRKNTVPSSAYENMTLDSRAHRASIQSDIVREDVLRLFISQQITHEDSIKANCDYERLSDPHSRDSLRLLCLDDFYLVKLNDSLVTSLNWKFHNHPKNQHRGIISYLDISQLGRGGHELEVELNLGNGRPYATIPFYKD